MGIKIQTTNTPVDENGNAVGSDGKRLELREVDESEFKDLYRWGMVVFGKGDVNEDGSLKAKVAKEAAPEVQAVTGQVPVQFQKTEA